MKRLIFLITIFLLAIVSCKQGPKGSQAEAIEERDFLTMAISGSEMEVALGKLAMKQALETRVRKFAEMMTADHSDAAQELRALAANKNISIDANIVRDHEKHILAMQKKSGVAFDKAYLRMMLKDHKKNIREFEDVIKTTKDEDLKALATKLLPTLKKHLDSARSINRKVKASLEPSDMTNAVETFPQR